MGSQTTPSIVFTLGLAFESIKEFGVRHSPCILTMVVTSVATLFPNVIPSQTHPSGTLGLPPLIRLSRHGPIRLHGSQC
jgi:hypothetical protein